MTGPDLPPDYAQMDPAELKRRIGERKRRLAPDLCILGHHYQSDEVIAFADLRGDSLKLSQEAAKRKDAKYIVFCGVHFMAESADVLSGPDQAVILPNLRAGCPLAETADEDAVATALEELRVMAPGRVVPITYVNSSAAVKALTGRAGGACCTSSNVANVFAWALRPASQGGAGAEKVLAIPDEHLGRNTAVAMGHKLEDCVVYDPARPNGGLTAERLAGAKFILWKGHCYVHQRFTPEQVAAVRRERPDIKVIVHPECPYEVVKLSDASGSTEQIIRAVVEGPPKQSWAIGTENHLVSRLAREYPDRCIRPLSDGPSVCAQMAAIDLPHLLWVLDNLAEGRMVNRVTVGDSMAQEARSALERMIQIQPARQATRRQ